MDFLNDKNKEEYDKSNSKQKKILANILMSATFAILRGIDSDLYSETATEMKNLLNDFQSFLMRTDFTNKDLQILKNLLQQGRNIIKDLIENKKDI